MKKSFRIESVLGIVTGFVLEDGGFGGMQELMDHFYPGIMTIGCAAMSPAAKAEILRQHPKLREVAVHCPEGGRLTSEQIADFLRYARVCVGDTLEIQGPLEVSSDEAAKAFSEFLVHD